MNLGCYRLGCYRLEDVDSLPLAREAKSRRPAMVQLHRAAKEDPAGSGGLSSWQVGK